MLHFYSTLSPSLHLEPYSEPGAVIDERYFLSLYSQGARAVLRYLQQVESRITDAEARGTRSRQSLVAQLTKELTRVKATLARKKALCFSSPGHHA